MTAHGYVCYTTGCRCLICKAAKAAYMRERRAVATGLRLAAEAAGEVYVAVGIAHGISGYSDAKCRCRLCRRAWKAAAVRRRRAGGR